MGKISQVSSKYIVYATIEIDGVVDRPDVIGAIFGQTEGLLGVDLELRELQRSGRIGRIEVNVDTKTGKTQGDIIIPSSLDKAETSIIAAALEIIQRIGPCNAKVHVNNIEDVRISKRTYVIERAKTLLKQLMDTTMPDSQELSDEVASSVRVMEIQEYGPEKLAAGPAIDESDEIIVVEGRADVLNLLKHGFKNSIAMNGANCPKTIINLSKEKSITLFVDGDRGGDLNIKNLLSSADIDYVTRAPDGKEVEELTQKEIHKAIRSKIAAEQMKLELQKVDTSRLQKNTAKNIANNINNIKQEESQSENGFDSRNQNHNNRDNNGRREYNNKDQRDNRNNSRDSRDSRDSRAPQQSQPQRFKKPEPTKEEKDIFSTMLEDLVGTKAACVLDEGLNVLGKVPLSELDATLKSIDNGVYALIFDGTIDKSLVNVARNTSIQYLVGMDSNVKPNETKIKLLTVNEL
ncbi:DNA primase [Candidatus Woesearchaeota archaeon]|nr:DNA primase [Candidatus Woesearchaeota archaeon]